MARATRARNTATTDTGKTQQWVITDTDIARLATLTRWYTLDTDTWYYTTTPHTQWAGATPKQLATKLSAFRRRTALYAGNTPPYCGTGKLIGPNAWWWATTHGTRLAAIGWDTKTNPSPLVARHAAAAAQVGWQLENAGWHCIAERELQRGTTIGGDDVDPAYYPTAKNGARHIPDLLAWHPAHPTKMCAIEVELTAARGIGYYTDKLAGYERSPNLAHTIYVTPAAGAAARIQRAAQNIGYAHKLTTLQYHPGSPGAWLNTTAPPYQKLLATLNQPTTT